MPRRLSVIVFLFATLACSKTSPIVARAGDATITAAELSVAMKLAEGSYDPTLLKDAANIAAFRQGVLDDLIDLTILAAEAKRQGITVSADEIATTLKDRGTSMETIRRDLDHLNVSVDAWRAQLIKRLTVAKLIDHQIVELVPVSDDDAARYFREHRHEFDVPEQFHARQIVVDKAELADLLHEKLTKGEDFATLAGKNSQSPDRERGGDLGWFDIQTAPAVFSEICAKLHDGETSAVTKTDFGYQIFQLIERRPGKSREFDEAKPLVTEHLRRDRGETAFSEWLTTLKASTPATIDDKQLAAVKLD